MIRRLMLLVATLLALFSESTYALGLGDLELKSALNQQFSAEINLMNIGALEIEEVLPKLASQVDFDRVGVERHFLLMELQFKVRKEADGSMVILVTSARPITEPFLNFVVEVLWPTGRVLREYTVLLDPPVFGQQSVAPISSSDNSPAYSSSSNDSPSNDSPPTSTGSGTRSTQSQDNQSAMPGDGVISDGEYGMTGSGDTLWSIAKRVRPDGAVSVQQTMLALQKANPEAFIGNNINLLKAGHVLRIPNRDEILEASVSEAVTEVGAQNEEFEDYKTSGIAQLDATRRSSSSSVAETTADDGELRLLATDKSSGQNSGESDLRIEELENELAVAREDLDRSRRANSEINVRMDDLAGQLETLNEMVALKDDQLAALRAQIQKSLEAADKPAPAPPVATQPTQSLFSNPMVLGGLGLFLVIAVVVVLVLMRRRQHDSEMSEDDFSEAVLHDVDLGEEEAEFTDDEIDDEEYVEQQTSDVISDAEVYIAYGKFSEAITFLESAMEEEPSRADIQLKLLEVYLETEDAAAFDLQFDQLEALGDEQATAEATSLQSQMQATIISAEPVAEDDELEDDLSFDLDDLDSDAEDDDLNLDPGDELDLDDAEDMEFDLDLDLDLEGDQGEILELDSDKEAGSDNDLGLEFDGELKLDLDDGDDIFTLDLDDDEEIDLDGLDLGSELEDDDGAISLDLDDDGEIDFGEDDELDPGDENEIELDLDDDLDLELELDLDIDDDLELGLDDDLELDLDDDLELDLDDDLELDLDDDLELDLEIDDDLELDLGDLELDSGADSKLDLARAYVEMGSNDEARAKLQEVIAVGSDAEIKEANELLEKLD